MPVRCLLVDDNTEFLASATRLLESQGVEVVGRASTGAEALLLAGSLHPDVVLVDIELGNEDGIELAQAIGGRVPAAAVILISTYERDDLEELISGGQILGFIPKSSLGAAAVTELVGG